MKFRSDSMYRNTGMLKSGYLDVQSPVITNVNDYNTKTIKLTVKYEHRPDLLAHELYGNAKLWWVFAEFNPDLLNDPIVDFKTGITIKYPVRFS